MYFLLRVMQIDPFEMLHSGPLNPVSLLFQMFSDGCVFDRRLCFFCFVLFLFKKTL